MQLPANNRAEWSKLDDAQIPLRGNLTKVEWEVLAKTLGRGVVSVQNRRRELRADHRAKIKAQARKFIQATGRV